MSSEPTTDTPASAAMDRGRPSRHTLVLKLALLAVVVAGAYSLGYWRNQPQAPQSDANVAVQAGFVGFEPAGIDLGTHLWDTVVPFDLSFVNQSAATVIIQHVEASCDCVVVEAESLAGRAIAPGEVLPLAPDQA